MSGWACRRSRCARPPGPIGGDNTHEFLVLASTGESEVFYDSAITDLKFGDRVVNYDDRAECAAIVKEWTTPYARTDETHDEAIFDAIPEARRKVLARDRGGADLLLRHQVFRTDGRLRDERRGRARAGRRWAATASA